MRENIIQALAIEKIHAEINFYWIEMAKAMEIGLMGSPSIFINNKELQPVEAVGFC